MSMTTLLLTRKPDRIETQFNGEMVSVFVSQGDHTYNLAMSFDLWTTLIESITIAAINQTKENIHATVDPLNIR